jgi:DNA-binding XRE family transcriptional regulator
VTTPPTFDDLTAGWTDDRRRSVAARLDDARSELLAHDLAELRAARRVTQVDLATALGRSQSTISAIESASDHRVSTLRNIVRSLGGHLEITAVFDDQRIRLIDPTPDT